MTENHPTEFVCPGCGSGYKVVLVKADADLPYRLIHCRVCKHPLTAMDGQHVLKYFLVRRAKSEATPMRDVPAGPEDYKQLAKRCAELASECSRTYRGRSA